MLCGDFRTKLGRRDDTCGFTKTVNCLFLLLFFSVHGPKQGSSRFWSQIFTGSVAKMKPCKIIVTIHRSSFSFGLSFLKYEITAPEGSDSAPQALPSTRTGAHQVLLQPGGRRSTSVSSVREGLHAGKEPEKKKRTKYCTQSGNLACHHLEHGKQWVPRPTVRRTHKTRKCYRYTR